MQRHQGAASYRKEVAACGVRLSTESNRGWRGCGPWPLAGGAGPVLSVLRPLKERARRLWMMGAKGVREG